MYRLVQNKSHMSNSFAYWSQQLPNNNPGFQNPDLINPHSCISNPDSERMKRKWGELNCEIPSLALGLGSSSENSRLSSHVYSAKENDEIEEVSTGLSLNFELSIGQNKNLNCNNDNSICQRKRLFDPEFDLNLSLSTPDSLLTTQTASKLFDESSKPSSISLNPNFPSLSTTSSVTNSFPSHHQGLTLNSVQQTLTLPSLPDLSIIPTIRKSSSLLSTSTTTTSNLNPNSTSNPNSSSKTCQFPGCLKGARGASGRCIGHGGGKRCQRLNCQKGAEGKTIFCKAHGGGKRCTFLGCTKSAEGKTDFCIAHGGGRRCSHTEGCTRAARGRSGLCIRHGGGKRCSVSECSRSAEGQSGLCISHGGGKRCQFLECNKGAQGSTKFCKAHGGGKRCTFFGCNKGAEGSTLFCKGHGGGKRCNFEGGGVCPKSVHGGTLFCVAHGGGKRCGVRECTKSARGRTEFCVRHGGGKRCVEEGCGKSAQGSTEFCKAHGGGGGKRCEVEGCERFVRGKMGICDAHGAMVRDDCVRGGIGIGGVKWEFEGGEGRVTEGRVHGGKSLMMALLGSNGTSAGTGSGGSVGNFGEV